MPRHPVAGARSAATAPEAAHDDPAQPPPIPGGAGGMPDMLPMAARNPYGQMAALQGRAEVRADEYMVVDGPRTADGKIRYNAQNAGQSYMVGLLPGKIVTASTHNLDQMRKQGIRLDPMPKLVADEEAEAAEPDAGEQAPAVA